MTEQLILRFIHVLAGVFWGGALFFFTFFLSPILRDAGPEGGRVMMRIGQSKYPPFMAMIGLLTILTGLRMYIKLVHQVHGMTANGMVITLGIGGAAAIVAWLFGMFVMRPTAGKMGELAKAIGGGAPTAEQAAEVQRLRQRLNKGAHIAAGFVLIAVICMAVARYVA